MLVAPPLRRRLGCLTYEAILTIGIAMGISMVFTSLFGRTSDQGIFFIRLIFILAIGIYFSYIWHRSGQTLAMKTWHIKLINNNSKMLSIRQATIRYFASWLWISPVAMYYFLIGISSHFELIAALLVGMLLYAALSFLFLDRQYLHDKMCKTRLIDIRGI